MGGDRRKSAVKAGCVGRGKELNRRFAEHMARRAGIFSVDHRLHQQPCPRFDARNGVICLLGQTAIGVSIPKAWLGGNYGRNATRYVLRLEKESAHLCLDLGISLHVESTASRSAHVGNMGSLSLR